MGPPWGTTWFHLTGDVPALGGDMEIVVDLGWSDSWPGFQCEGLAYRPDGTVVKGLNPRNDWLPVTGGQVDLYVEAASNPMVFEEMGGFAPTPLGDKATAGDRPTTARATLWSGSTSRWAGGRGRAWTPASGCEVSRRLTCSNVL